MTKEIRLPFKGLTLPAQPWVLNRLWDTVDELEKMMGRPNKFRVCVWGSKRPKPPHPLYKAVYAMSRRFAAEGIEVVTGGGPGVMEAANAGARAGKTGKTRTYGIRTSIRSEPANPHIDTVFDRRTFHSRLHQFVTMSSAFVVCDPGVGTLLEMLLVWQLLKEGHLQGVPLILVGECWDGLLEWMDNGMLRNGHKRSEELATLYRVPNCRAAIPIVLAANTRFQAANATV